jgi:hypothetical protein
MDFHKKMKALRIAVVHRCVIANPVNKINAADFKVKFVLDAIGIEDRTNRLIVAQ